MVKKRYRNTYWVTIKGIRYRTDSFYVLRDGKKSIESTTIIDEKDRDNDRL